MTDDKGCKYLLVDKATLVEEASILFCDRLVKKRNARTKDEMAGKEFSLDFAKSD